MVFYLAISVLSQECQKGHSLVPNYEGVFSPEDLASHSAFRDLAGFTRSTYQANYALVTPESRVWLHHRDWPGCKTCHIISRATPSHFSMLLVQMKVRSWPDRRCVVLCQTDHLAEELVHQGLRQLDHA
jgi:hypothetical protein